MTSPRATPHRATSHRAQPRRTRGSTLARGVFSLLSAVAVGLGITVAAQPAAAAPNGNVVVVGDSYAANPDQYYNTFRDIEGFVPDNYPRQSGCLQAPNSWPKQMQKRHNIPVNDWSCSGLTSKRAIARIEAAHRAGDIHAGTRSVVLNWGMNNYGPNGSDNGADILNPADVRNRYLADTRAAVAKVKTYAPQAKIVFAGQHSITSNGTFCFVNVVPNLPAGLPIPVLADVERWVRGIQIEAANQARAPFVDFKAETAGNATCAPDNQRHISGIIDTTTPNYNMIIHPNLKGSNFMADRMSRAV
ncbi:MAG: GDSL-type esterase/lipase family protein [Mycobacteriaceae bacterium]|uniref:GDSL-type esterase/lipase family protein n=1 Tax=Corynebacterium sp. TaxID=1720 RepID=UPI003F995841